MLRSRPVIASCIVLAILGACSSDDDGDSSADTVSVVESAPASADDDGTSSAVDPEASTDSSDVTDTEPHPTDAPTTTAAPTTTTTEPPPPALSDDVALPIVFVHGFAGSAQQYESQAMRFTANGYPQERIVAFDHDGAGMDIEGYANGVDAVIDDALATFGTEQVYLVGHSRGTMVSSSYLQDPARAAKVAKYVAIDGAPCVEVVPCLAPNQANLPGQAHVETATSEESFAMQYEFLVGEAPEIVEIVQQDEPIVIEGRAVNFPANTGRAGATLDIWEIDAATGQRTADAPHASFELAEDGAFGPTELAADTHYEYVLTSPDTDVEHHLYLQPYLRSSHLVRLLSSGPDGATRANTNTGDGHSAIIAMRMREWYGSDDPDLDGDERDVLDVSVDGGPSVNVIDGFETNGAIGIHFHDDAATPGESTLAALPYFSEQPFQQGIDVFMPASADGSGTISIVNIPRGDATAPQMLNVPNWPSSTHSISVVFTDVPID